MAIWPLYHYDATVPCEKCNEPISTAREGAVVGFGDGNGNRELTCKCGHKTIYDVTRSQLAAEAHIQEHGEMFERASKRLNGEPIKSPPLQKKKSVFGL